MHATDSSAPLVYSAGDLLIDTGRATVQRDGQDLALPKLTFDLLLAFVRAAPNLLSYDDLHERIWPGVVVSPETVSQRVKLLRAALGDDSRSPRYLVGVRGRGYRLIVPVSLVEPHRPETARLPDPVTADATPAARPAGRRRSWIAGVVVVGVAAVAGLALVIWQASHRPTATLPPGPVPLPALETSLKRSVAVLPFANLSGNADDRLLALGVSEGVLHQLASVNQLMVIARTSSFALGERGLDIREIGRRLNARYVLEGSVQRDPLKLRITAQLVDSTTGVHLWSMRFDRPPTDLFKVQDEIAAEVTRALKVSIDQADRGVSRASGTQDLEAWTSYQRGRAKMVSRKRVDLEQARVEFERASRLDPRFANALVSLADARLMLAWSEIGEFWNMLSPPLEPGERRDIESLLSRALELDPQNGDAYIVRGWLAQDPILAASDYRRGLMLAPSNAAGLERTARLFVNFPDRQGRPYDPERRAEAMQLIERAIAVDPQSPTARFTKSRILLFEQARVDDAVAVNDELVARNPDFYPGWLQRGELRWIVGRTAEAARDMEHALAIEPGASWVRLYLSRVYLDLGDLAAARRVLSTPAESKGVGQIALRYYERDYRAAGEAVYRALQGRRFSAFDVGPMIAALLAHARTTGEYSSVRRILEGMVRPQWDDEGRLTTCLCGAPELMVMLAQVYRHDGQEVRTQRMLRMALEQMDFLSVERGRRELYVAAVRARALALLGDRAGAIRVLEARLERQQSWSWWLEVKDDPAFDVLRKEPAFIALEARIEARDAEQRELLRQMRERGEVPR